MTEQPIKTQEVEEKKRKKYWLIVLLLAALLAGGTYYYFLTRSTPMQVVSGDYLPDVKDAQKMSDKELKAAEQEVVDASKFNMVIKSQAVFESGESTGSLYIQNPVVNGYPINVVIHLDETDEEVYNSGAMSPGFEISGAKLDKILAMGDYPATATFNIYDPETNEKRGQVQAGIAIQINS
ncbi:hypothetical protein I6N95_23140 [Vagococcus sp. BWB3-3]|uniref:Uncharacterized protein n=1 Tax=Vagococcus allomyrinae TaxID=2794353 RepID=A0A940PJ98_9ENTE|nr:hypothetical protein [Vagococcus allomyrinae]MBP1043928.1 hypothetical protein [Vagococcus allomyrinae]